MLSVEYICENSIHACVRIILIHREQILMDWSWYIFSPLKFSGHEFHNVGMIITETKKMVSMCYRMQTNMLSRIHVCIRKCRDAPKGVLLVDLPFFRL